MRLEKRQSECQGRGFKMGDGENSQTPSMGPLLNLWHEEETATRASLVSCSHGKHLCFPG